MSYVSFFFLCMIVLTAPPAMLVGLIVLAVQNSQLGSSR